MKTMREMMRIVEGEAQPFPDDMSASDFFLQVCTFDDGVMRFKSNDSVPHDDIIKIALDLGLPVDRAKCDAARAVDKQDYAAAKDRIKHLTGSSIDQLRDFKNGKPDATTKFH